MAPDAALGISDLAKPWSRGTAILFAVGAVSGTVLSFELGLLWPTFMAFAGPIIGMPFSLEGFAFFLEAIFLGVYLYGWDRLRPSAHVFGLPPALAQPLAGDWAGKVLAHTQPAKLAALEGHFESETYAPVHLGGIPDVEAQQTRRDRDHKRLHVTTRRL